MTSWVIGCGWKIVDGAEGARVFPHARGDPSLHPSALPANRLPLPHLGARLALGSLRELLPTHFAPAYPTLPLCPLSHHLQHPDLLHDVLPQAPGAPGAPPPSPARRLRPAPDHSGSPLHSRHPHGPRRPARAPRAPLPFRPSAPGRDPRTARDRWLRELCLQPVPSPAPPPCGWGREPLCLCLYTLHPAPQGPHDRAPADPARPSRGHPRETRPALGRARHGLGPQARRAQRAAPHGALGRTSGVPAGVPEAPGLRDPPCANPLGPG